MIHSSSAPTSISRSPAASERLSGGSPNGRCFGCLAPPSPRVNFFLDMFTGGEVTFPAVMVTVPLASVETIPREARAALLTGLRADCKRHGITQQAIADAARVTRPFVVNLFAMRRWSAEVVSVARRLVAEAEARLKVSRGRKRAANGGEE